MGRVELDTRPLVKSHEEAYASAASYVDSSAGNNYYRFAPLACDSLEHQAGQLNCNGTPIRGP